MKRFWWQLIGVVGTILSFVAAVNGDVTLAIAWWAAAGVGWLHADLAAMKRSPR